MGPIDLVVTDGLADVVLDRPKVNALDEELLAALAHTFEGIARDDAIRGARLRGAGRCFSAGLDLRAFAGLPADGMHAFLDVFDAALKALFLCPKPVAAAVEGHAIAGGLVLALACDHVVFSEGDLRVGLTELAVGVPFPRGVFEIVRSELPPRALRRLAQEAETIPAKKAYKLGVGDARDEHPQRATAKWLARVCARPPAAFAALKKQRRGAVWRAVERDRAADREAFLAALQSDEARAALDAALA